MAPFKVAIYLYPSADILDFSGPTEIYSMRPASGETIFETKTFAHHDRVSSETGTMVYVPNGTFEQLEAQLADYDILVIPGAHFDVFDKLLPSKEGKELTALLRKFTGLAPRKEASTRILQSVCTGSLILAASGVLAGRTITTHHMGFDALKKYADDAAGGDSNVSVVRKRWVDAGTTEAGVRIINAAGVTSGIDTSLWIYEQLAGKEDADFVAEIAEFERRQEAWSA
jgi:putative intracellular protease/amidase